MSGGAIRLGISGLGRGFMLSLPAMRAHPHIELVAAFDPRPEARSAFARDFGGRAYADFAALCADREIDAIYIASPHQFHCEQSIRAVQAGKHVLVEKPMALDSAECRRMAAAASEAQVALLVGPSHGYDSQIELTRRLIDTGAYGQVRMLTMLTYTDFLYRPRRAEELDPDQGGGVVFSQASHQIDIVRRLIGSEIESVFARTLSWDPGRGGEGAYSAMLNFACGACATLVYNGHGLFDTDEFAGWISETGFQKAPRAGPSARSRLPEDGEAQLKAGRGFGGALADVDAAVQHPPHHEHFGLLIVSCDRADFRPTPVEVIELGHAGVRAHPLPSSALPRQSVFDALVSTARDGVAPVHGAEWSAGTIAACEAIRRSAAERRVINLLPHT
ncbi:MAG: Gfo/Idh/MocA family oxidoreductase [Pseudomonadota bacterium]